ncbi:MAG: dihydrofolate reductase family protein [Actinomycetota bacterium]
MPNVVLDISVSLDGFIAGPDATLEEPLGVGGERLHEWVVPLRAWREPHGMEGGETGPDGDVIAETVERAGAIVLGRRMFSGGSGPWEEDPNPNGWWGGEPPFHHPAFVVTHHQRDPLELKGTTFTFVTEGPETAMSLAREAAGEKDVAIGGGAQTAQQLLRAGLVDEVQLHLVPILLGGGVRLFEALDPGIGFDLDRVIDSPRVTHLRYRVKQ